MKTWLRILIALAGVGIIAAALVYKLEYNKPHRDIDKAKADYVLVGKALYDQFKANKNVADSLYAEKVLEITGTLSKTEQADTLVIAVMTFEQGDFGDQGIRCTMLPKYDAKMKQIAPGSEVKIKGLCKGYNDTDVIIEKCSVVE